MKWYIFKKFFIYISFFVLLNPVHAQEIKGEILEKSKYDHRTHHYQESWNKLVPSFLKAQYAGSMGVFSIGTGWDYGKQRQWETDLYLGYLPKFDSEQSKFTFTLRQNYIPWSVTIKNNFSYEPFSVAIYFTSILDEDFWPKQPEKYPDGYYWFSLRVRSNIALGQRIVYNIPTEKRNFSKSVTLFYEVSTNDSYILSAYGNDYIKLSDIIHLSLGLKFQLF